MTLFKGRLKNKLNLCNFHFAANFRNAKFLSIKGTAFNVEELQIKKTHAFIVGTAYLHSDYTNDCI